MRPLPEGRLFYCCIEDSAVYVNFAPMKKSNEKKKKVGRRVLSKLLMVLLVLLLVLTVVIVFAPAILSSDYARTAILKKVNEGQSFELSVGSWSFGWVSGVKLEKVVFSDHKNTVISVPTIEMTSGLLKLIPALKDIGEVNINEPHILVSVPAARQAQELVPADQAADIVVAEDKAELRLSTAETAEVDNVEKDKSTVALPFDIMGVIRLKGGIVDVTTMADGQKYIISDITGELAFKSIDKPVTFKLSLSQNNMQGRLTVSGNAGLFTDRIFVPGKVKAEAVLMMDNLTLKPFGLIANTYAGLPEFTGLMNTRLSLRMDTSDNIELEGNASLADLILSGGPVKDDRPYFDSIKCNFSLNRSGRNINISACTLQSPFGSFNASGTVKDTGAGFPQGSIQCNADIDLAVIASEFHNTLKIKKGLKITKGRILSSVTITSVPDKLKVFTDSKVTSVEAREAGKAISLDTPMHITASLSKTKDTMEIEDLSLTSRFAQGKGRGNLDNLSVSLEADIQQALKEAAKFVDLKGYDASGKMSALLTMNKSARTERTIDAKVSIKSLMFAGVTEKPLKQAYLDVRAACRLDFADDGRWNGANDLVFKIQAPALTADVTAVNAKPGDNPDEITVKGASLSIAADLDTLCDVLSRTGVLTNDLRLAGQLTVDSKLDISKGAVYATALNASIKKLEVKTGNVVFSDPQVVINGSLQASAKANVARVKDMTVSLTAGKIKISDVLVKDLKQPASDLEARLSADLDLGKISSGLSFLKEGGKAPSFRGMLNADFISSLSGSDQEIKVNATAADFVLRSETGIEIKEPVVKAAVNVKLERNSGAARLDTLKLTSGILTVDASGSYGGKRNQMIDISGRYESDLSKVAGIINSFSSTAISMEGMPKDSFRIRMPVDGRKSADLLRALEGYAGIQVAKVTVYGMDLRNISTKINSSGGVLSADVSTKFNDGDVNIMPRVVSTDGTMQFDLPDKSRVMNDVRLTDEMASEILAKLHPILKGSSVVSGKIGMSLDSCHAPLDQKIMKQQARFKGSFDMADASFKPSGIIAELFDLCGMEVKTYGVRNAKVDFECRDGKVESSPIQMVAGGIAVTLSGYVTLDGLMSYTAELPVTEKMIGKRYYQYVKDAKIKLMITGPVDKPGLAKESFKASLASLTSEAMRIIADNAKKAAEAKLQEMLKKQLEGSGTNKAEKIDFKKEANDLFDIILKKPDNVKE